jgi:hypothetical protein
LSQIHNYGSGYLRALGGKLKDSKLEFGQN